MIVFPKEYVKTKYAGYFWNVEEKKLYTIKVTGVLRPMKLCKGGFFHGYDIKPGYRISVNGVHHSLSLRYLNTLSIPEVNETVDILNFK